MKSKHRSDTWCFMFEYDVGGEGGLSGLSKEKLLVTGTEGTTGVVREVEDEEAREGYKGRVIAVEEVIVVDEGTKGV